MRAPPPLSSAVHYPITAGIAVMSLIISISQMTGKPIDSLTMDIRAFHGEPWRLVTAVFAHAGPLHLFFNLYWLWIFGTSIEGELGRWKTGAMFLLFACVPSAAEYAFEYGGIGLSGVIYGYFGFLWIAGRKDSRFSGAMDPSTIQLMIGWFFLCIGLTWAEILNIGNVAHGSGAVLGILLAASFLERGRKRWVYSALLVLAIGLIGLGSTVARPMINFNKRGVAQEKAYLGYLASTKNEYVRSIELYREALEIKGDEPDWWYNLGLAYLQTSQYERAVEALTKSDALRPDDPEIQNALRNAKEGANRR